MVDTKINVLFGTATVASQPWRFLRAGNVRVGKVSIEEILEACFRKSLMMRTRPRPSDVSREVRAGAKHRLHARSCGNLFLGSRAVMRTRPRLSGYAAKCVAGAKHRLHARSCGNLFPGSRAVMRTRPRLSGYAAKCVAGAKHRLHARSCGNLFPGSRAVMRTRPRLSDVSREGPQRPGGVKCCLFEYDFSSCVLPLGFI